jgi:hypothetical protein
LARLKRNLAARANNWIEYDKEIAYGIFIIEKEFNVGAITEDFPLLKFWNLLSEDNIKRFKSVQEQATKTMR